MTDVFVRDLLTGATKRVSQSQVGFGGDGASLAPAISPDGRYVSFASSADNLVPGDDEGLPDVFLADLRSGTIKMVSVNNKRQAQDRAVPSPFVQVSDVSRDGKVVVFDSDATNLDPDDRRLHTDVFARDVTRGKTTRLSVAPRREANSDSVYPRITPDGRFVTFESFANNLFPIDASGPDSFLYDRKLRPTHAARRHQQRQDGRRTFAPDPAAARRSRRMATSRCSPPATRSSARTGTAPRTCMPAGSILGAGRTSPSAIAATGSAPTTRTRISSSAG